MLHLWPIGNNSAQTEVCARDGPTETERSDRISQVARSATGLGNP